MVAVLKENYLRSALRSALQIHFSDILGISGFPMPSYTSVICLLGLPFRRQESEKGKLQFLYTSQTKYLFQSFTGDGIR